MKLLVYLKLKAEGFPKRYAIPCVSHLTLIGPLLSYISLCESICLCEKIPFGYKEVKLLAG